MGISTTTKYGLQQAPLPPKHCGQPMRYGTHRSGPGSEQNSYICDCGAVAWRDSFGRSITWNEADGNTEKADAAKDRYSRSVIRDITRGQRDKKEDLSPDDRATYEFILSGI